MQNQTQWQLQKDQVTWKDRSDAVRFLRDKRTKKWRETKHTDGNERSRLGESSWLECASSSRHRMALHRYDNGMEWINEWEDYKRRASVARRQLGPLRHSPGENQGS